MSSSRLKSIDIIRALTMFLMIFVNDLWTLTNIPEWLGHKAAHDDGMGLADVVFPAFLFIVGLSIPHAIRARLGRGNSRLQVVWHIVERSMALLIMGIYMVNLENIDRDALLFSKFIWQILMTLGFFMIWNNYQGKVLGKIPPAVIKATGWALLVFLAIVYKGPGDQYHWMRVYWWGILGLIGWGYLLCALVYLVVGNRPVWIAVICGGLLLLNVNEFTSPFGFRIRLVVGAANYASVMLGVLATSIMISLMEKKKMKYFELTMVATALSLLAAGFLTRPHWGISKILATPSWTMICAGITMLSFALLHAVIDRLKYSNWANPIEPAGYSTLTCYLVPYYVYALAALTGLHLPDVLNSGLIGILKSILFSILIIQVTGLLGRVRVRLKI